MDENNNMNDMNNQPPKKENPFKNQRFYMSYFITIGILCVISFLLTSGNLLGGVFIFCIPYAIIGLIVWATVRMNNKPAALGILLGSVTPFIAIFIATGGCGLFTGGMYLH